MNRDDYRQQEEDEHHFYIWSCLQALKSSLSAETFQTVERELGLAEEVVVPAVPKVNVNITDCTF